MGDFTLLKETLCCSQYNHGGDAFSDLPYVLYPVGAS